MLQPMALEVFSGDGRNYLLAFPRKQRNKVYQKFMTTATGISDSAQQSVAGQKRTANVEQATSLLSNLIGETSVTQRLVFFFNISYKIGRKFQFLYKKTIQFNFLNPFFKFLFFHLKE